MSKTSERAVRDTGGSTKKVDLIAGAYSQLRISGITRSPTPEDLEVALDRLEDMAAEWGSRSLAVGYHFEDAPDPNSASGVIRAYSSAFKTNLAVRLIPDFNKAVPPTLQQQAVQSLSNLTGRAAAERMRETSYPSRMPTGSGNGNHYNRWARFYSGVDDVQGSASVSLFTGDIEDFTEHFGSYLRLGETVASYSLVADEGLSVVSDSLASPDVTYRIEATGSEACSAQVTIIATTSTGRVVTRRRFFTVQPRD